MAAGYHHGYNRRAPALALLIVEPQPELLRVTVARYLVRASFAMAVLPGHVAAAARMFAFDGIVLPTTLDAETRTDVLTDLGPRRPRIVDIDDPIRVARALRTHALRA